MGEENNMLGSEDFSTDEKEEEKHNISGSGRKMIQEKMIKGPGELFLHQMMIIPGQRTGWRKRI